jgi:antitoxin CptB
MSQPRDANRLDASGSDSERIELEHAELKHADLERAELQRLRWRCRRGMRELDQLFGRYLDRGWPTADAADRANFERLLDCEDDILWRWCLGYDSPEDPVLHALVQRILALPV